MDENQQNLTPQKKHQIWVKNSGYLYDRLVIQKLKWPSLTFQWLPTKQQQQNQTKYQFLYATHTSGSQQIQSLHIGQVIFPKLRDLQDPQTNLPAVKVKGVQRFNHQTQINKARYCQKNPALIAAKTDSGALTIFKRGNDYPFVVLQGNLQGGFSLQWKQHGLISGDHQGNIMAWRDIQSSSKPSVTVKWNDKIQDVKWIHQNSFCSVGDDGKLCIWDPRDSKVQQAVLVTQKGKQVYSCAVNYANKFLLVTAGEDQSVRLWDLRSLKKRIHSFEGHQASVTSLDWSRVNTTMLASGSQDKKVKLWDLMKIGAQVPRDQSGLQQIVFTHQGHIGQVTDLGWNHHQMILGSTQQQNNTLQMYQITNNIEDMDYMQDIDYLKKQCYL